MARGPVRDRRGVGYALGGVRWTRPTAVTRRPTAGVAVLLLVVLAVPLFAGAVLLAVGAR